METIEYRTNIDKAEWGPGPWVSEPDKAQWQDPATGLPCLIVRNVCVTGALCGYVGVPELHPYYGKKFTDDDLYLSVHCGLSFSGPCQTHGDMMVSVCHVPAEGEPDNVWWLGFDCAHAWDFPPRLNANIVRIMGRREDSIHEIFGEVYRDFAYVKSEVTKLAAQLAAVV
jgi:hypothetical protein